jgi:hypothetical protein
VVVQVLVLSRLDPERSRLALVMVKARSPQLARTVTTPKSVADQTEQRSNESLPAVRRRVLVDRTQQGVAVYRRSVHHFAGGRLFSRETFETWLTLTNS